MLTLPRLSQRSVPASQRFRFRPQLETLEDRTAPAIFFVTNLGDSNVLNSGSLRDAISQANTAGGTNVIQFTGAAASGTILLNGGNFGLPTIMNNLTIQGPGAGTLTVQRPAADVQQFGIFTVGVGVVSTISGLTLTGGDATSEGGGGINNYGTLTVNDCVITGNQTTFTGGGINNQNKLYVNRCTVSNNQAYYSGAFTGYGGGIQNVYDAARDRLLVITDSTLANNTANQVGGAIDNSGTVRISGSTFNGNQVVVSNGGALENRTNCVMTVVNSTIFGNTAEGKGGGVRNLGTLTLTNSTVSGNTAVTTDGGGISQYPGAGAGSITLQNTIVAGNNAPLGPDIQANGVEVVTANYCFIGTLAGATIVGSNNRTGNPMLGPLQDNGGLTQTMALSSGSQARDAGSNALAAGLTADQTGRNRIVNNVVDIGAFEFQPPATTTTVVSSLNPSDLGQNVTFTATVTATAPGSNVPQGTVTFLDNGTTLATVALTGGSASFSTAALTAGGHTITAQYNGFTQGSFTFSTSSASLTQTVTAPSPLPPPPPPPPPSPVPPPFVSVAFVSNGQPTDVLTLTGTQQVLEVVTPNGVLTQFDGTGHHQLATGVRSASVAFGVGGEVMVVVFQDGRLFQFDAAGTHLLASGILSANVTFTPGGTQEVLEVVFADGTLVQFDAAGAHQLATGVRSASVAFGVPGEVLDLVFADGRLFQFDAGGVHQLATGVLAAAVALSPAGQEVLDVIFAHGIEAFGTDGIPGGLGSPDEEAIEAAYLIDGALALTP